MPYPSAYEAEPLVGVRGETPLHPIAVIEAAPMEQADGTHLNKSLIPIPTRHPVSSS